MAFRWLLCAAPIYGIDGPLIRLIVMAFRWLLGGF